MAPPRLGVIICSSFGREEICAHRSLRALAQALAQAGVPALRFDYPATGDSGGGDDAGAWCAAWVQSVHRTADALKQACGVQAVAIVGMRLGAALGAMAALERGDVAGLGAIAPVVKGRAFVRELTVLQSQWAAAQGQDAQPLPQLMQSGGTLMTLATRDAVSAIDLLTAPRPPAPKVLLIDRDDMPRNDKWRELLEQQGACVEHLALPGYAGMVDNPHRTVVPQAMVDAVVAWAVQLNDQQAAQPLQQAANADTGRDAAALAETAELVPGVSERAVQLPGTPLFGILSLPAQGQPQRAVLMLNAGSIRHTGAGRVSVLMARRWAVQGWAVLRMDVSGIGDSAPRPGAPDNEVYTLRAQDDIDSALAYLRNELGIRQCVGTSVCSGGYHLFKAAVRGAPLDGVVPVNPLVFFWKDGMELDAPMAAHAVASEAARYQKSMLDPAKWLKLIKGQADYRALVGVMSRRVLSKLTPIAREAARALRIPLADDLGAELLSLAKRGVALAFVFSAGDPGLELLRNQGGRPYEQLKAEGKIEITMIPGADHVFTDYGKRQALSDVLTAALDAIARRS